MKEFQQIIEAYQESYKQKKKTALATVVKVDGSAYRRPGARMLVTEDGVLTGAISGGCLEGDALRKAQSVIFQQKSMLVTYDTTDEDDQKFGVGLGCNGIIQVLIEPIDPEDRNNPIELLKIALSDREPSVFVTVFSLKRSREAQIGSIGLFKSGKQYLATTYPTLPGNLREAMENHILQTKATFGNQIISYPQQDDLIVFYENIKAPVRILLFGAGNDTIPLSKMAHLLGWEVCLLDGRKQMATQARFPQANKILAGPLEETLPKVERDKGTVALLMSHNFEYEVEAMRTISTWELPYIGILGPKKKTEKLLDRLQNEGVSISDDQIYGPIGLDIGAEGSEEIALSVLAEIKAVLAQKSGQHLRDKSGPIHEEER